MKKNGFTLVELLAVIVILGALSIIIIPRINAAIENSRKNSAVVSANEYSKAITQYYLNNESNLSVSNINTNGTYEVENGTLSKDGSNYKININGQAPTSGKVNLINGEVTSGCLIIDNYSIIITDSQVAKVGKENCPKMIPDHIIDEVIYYEPDDIKANPLYFNPETAEYCVETQYRANMEATQAYPKTGCLKWYAYSENADGTINMIMAHNTSSYSRWTNDGIDDSHTTVDPNSDYFDGDSVGITYNYSLTGGSHKKNISGPVTALKQLKTDTTNWNSSLSRSDSYTPTSGEYKYKINYSGYKARLITAEEIAAIVNTSWENVSFYLQTGTYSITPTYRNNETSIYSWLFDYTTSCTSSGCSIAANENNLSSGYWTATSANGASEDIHTMSSWYVGKLGYFSTLLCTNPNYNGIRPVITFEKPENF